jgi:predicted metalloprotease
MRRMKIASLDVYLNDDDKVPSRLTNSGPKQFELDICPMMDERLLNSFKKKGMITGSTVELMQTIIAHELGHFVAHITGCPTHKHDKFQKIETEVGGKKTIVGVSVGAEMQAWTIAGHILGDSLNKQLRAVATATYLMGGLQQEKAA